MGRHMHTSVKFQRANTKELEQVFFLQNLLNCFYLLLWLFNTTPSSLCPFNRKKEQATTKKERVTHCLTICENIVAQSLR